MVGVAALRATFPGPAAYARTARQAALRVEGVARVFGGAAGWFRETPGVLVELDAEGHIHIRIRIAVAFGHDALAAGILAQNAIAAALKRAATEPVARIDVVVAGFSLRN